MAGDRQTAGGEQAEVLAKTDGGVKVDAREVLSYADYARQRAEPVVTVQRIIDRRAPQPEPVKTARPNIQLRQEVLWAEASSEPPPRQSRAAATVHSEVMHRAPPPKAPRKGIGSMEPQGRG